MRSSSRLFYYERLALRFVIRGARVAFAFFPANLPNEGGELFAHGGALYEIREQPNRVLRQLRGVVRAGLELGRVCRAVEQGLQEGTRAVRGLTASCVCAKKYKEEG